MVLHHTVQRIRSFLLLKHNYMSRPLRGCVVESSLKATSS